jgi:hypothetical protein
VCSNNNNKIVSRSAKSKVVATVALNTCYFSRRDSAECDHSLKFDIFNKLYINEQRNTQTQRSNIILQLFILFPELYTHYVKVGLSAVHTVFRTCVWALVKGNSRFGWTLSHFIRIHSEISQCGTSPERITASLLNLKERYSTPSRD